MIGYRRKVSRVEAFAEQGVSLRFPARSWSGVRADDGAVVIALREGEVQSALDGFRCLLWAPVIEGATEWIDRPAKAERLQHCRLALLNGGAEGLVVGGPRGEVNADGALELGVELRQGEYWAFWGSVACAYGVRDGRLTPDHATPELVRMAA
jgi:hypothetical protein